jgi:hypothetical protein
MNDALSAGPSRAYNLLKPTCKFWTKFGIYLLSLAIIIGYMFVLYWNDNWSKLGFIVGISIIVMDIFNLILYSSKIVGSAFMINLLLLINRVLMVSLGTDFWVYGFMILYIVYSLFFVIYGLGKAFPIANHTDANNKRSILDAPDVLLAILTTVYMGAIFFIQFVDFKGKNIYELVINKG